MKRYERAMDFSVRHGRLCSSFFLLALALGLAACGAADEQQEEEALDDIDSEFSVLNTAGSILPVIESRAGAPRVCLGLIGFGRETLAADNWYRRAIPYAMTSWNNLLAGNSEWSVRRIAPSISMQNSECAPTTGDFRINVWRDARTFTSSFCGRRPSWVCASSTSTGTRTMNIGPVNRGAPASVYDSYTLLHELGHLLGMADTYRISGSHDWIGAQPPSVMNRGSLSLTRDDQLGLWVALRAVKTGVRSCSGFGAAQTMTSNIWGSIMCDSTRRPITTHH